MRILQPYRQLNKLRERESLEPNISWALRMAIAAMAPLLWGVYSGKPIEAGWIAFIAETICWVELKGDLEHRIKLLAGGSVLALTFGLLGSITGGVLWLSVVAMAVVGFITSILKNIGDRGSALAICVFAIFIFCNAYPTDSWPELKERMLQICIGVAWNAVAAIVASLFVPAQMPYRRSIAVIWKTISELTNTISQGWDGVKARSKEHDIYLKEQAIRTAIDASMELFEKGVNEATEKDGHEYTLAHVRKAAAIVGAQMVTISNELAQIDRAKLNSSMRVKIFTLLRATQQVLERIAAYTTSLDEGEEIILQSRIARLHKLCLLLKEKLVEEDTELKVFVERVVQLTERNTKIIESAYANLRQLKNEGSMIRSYSLMKTIFILNPRYWWRYLSVLFSFSTLTAKYAVRSAVAAAVAMFIYKFWNIDHGYWLPFTVLIVMQTYFGATWKKSRDRVLGTVAGGIVGGLFLRLPTGVYLQEAMLFLTFVPMIVFLRKRYSVAVFFITINLVLLFNINKELDSTLIVTRALATMGGAAIAIVAGFALLPLWDKKMLPGHMAHALKMNYEYFLSIFYRNEDYSNWTKNKRKAESANSNAFDSFSRYMQEPSLKKKPISIFYYIIMHNIRITRELNNTRLEHEIIGNTDMHDDMQYKRVQECLEWFNKNAELINNIDAGIKIHTADSHMMPLRIPITRHQQVYIEKMLVELKGMHHDLEILAEKLPQL